MELGLSPAVCSLSMLAFSHVAVGWHVQAVDRGDVQQRESPFCAAGELKADGQQDTCGVI